MTEPFLKYSGELGRKALHLLALVLPAAVLVVGKPDVLWGLVPIALTALALDLLRVRSAGLNRFIDAVFGWMMRPAERPAPGEPAHINGATWVLLSMASLTILFPVETAVAAFVVFMLGDAAAALVGRRFGRHLWTDVAGGRAGCSVEGSIAFLVVGLATALFLVTTGLVAIPLWALGVMALVACVLEALPVPLNDNLAAPLGAAVVLQVLLLIA